MIPISGTPYEMGRLHGAACKNLILRNIGTVKSVIASKGVKQTNYDCWLDKNERYLASCHPEQVEEMKGIANGAGIPYHDILLINLQLYFMADQLPNECSSIIVRGSATLDGKTYIAKIRDMNGSFDHVVLHRTFADSLESVEVHAAGTITYSGLAVNNLGLSVTSTGMWSRKYPVNTDLISQAQLQINPADIVRCCRSREEVGKYLDTHKRMIRLNLLVADKSGASVFEMIDESYDKLDDQDGILMRSNHFHSPRLTDYNPTFQQYPSTYYRYERGMEYLRGHCGSIRFQDLLEICSDHKNGVNSICRHDEKAGPTTSFVSVNVLEDNQVWTIFGHACQAIQLDGFSV